MNLADEAVYTRTEIALYLEQWLKETQVHQLWLSLEIFVVIPLDDRVLELTYSICVAENFQNSIFNVPLLSVIVVGEHSIFGRVG